MNATGNKIHRNTKAKRALLAITQVSNASKGKELYQDSSLAVQIVAPAIAIVYPIAFIMLHYSKLDTQKDTNDCEVEDMPEQSRTYIADKDAKTH